MLGRSHQKLNWIGGGIAAIFSIFFAIYLTDFKIVWKAELATLDSGFNIRGERINNARDSDIVIVGIDDESFAELNLRWPFPREYFARAVDNLSKAGAKLIVFDVMFLEHDQENAYGDSILAEAISRAGNVISAGKIDVETDPHVSGVIQRTFFPIKPIRDASLGCGFVNIPEDDDGFIRRYVLNVQTRENSYPSLAVCAFQKIEEIRENFSIFPNQQNLLLGERNIPLYKNSMIINYLGPAKTFPTFSFADVLDTEDFDLAQSDTDYMERYISNKMPDFISASFDQIERLKERVNLLSQAKIRDDNLIDSLKNKIEVREMLVSQFWQPDSTISPFQDKIVFIGGTIEEIPGFDVKLTPFLNYGGTGKTPGVECHANAYYTLSYGDFVNKIPTSAQYLIIIFLAMITFIAIADFKPFKGLLFTILFMIIFIVVAFVAFILHSMWIEIIPPLVGMGFSYAGCASIQFLAEQRDKRMIKRMFSLYVPDKVVSELIAHPETAQLGGERRDLSILFADIADFTTISENLDPTQLVALLNDCLTEMTDIVLQNDGIIDKYEGDLIMAEFGAPLPNEKHALLGCRTMLQMQKKLIALRKKWSKQGLPELKMRIGLNCGEVALGNFGSHKVFDYTVMGDEVNVASRLEGVNKNYGTNMLISQNVYEKVKDEMITRNLDVIRVKGKSQPVRAYELIATKGEKRGLFVKDISIIPLYEQALEQYLDRNWKESISLLERILNKTDQDQPSRILLERCRDFLNNPPAPDWDGVFVMTSK